MDFGGHDRIETHGTVHMLGVEYADGTRTVTLTQSELLPQGGNLELHWACVFEGSDEWCLPPDGAVRERGVVCRPGRPGGPSANVFLRSARHP